MSRRESKPTAVLVAMKGLKKVSTVGLFKRYRSKPFDMILVVFDYRINEAMNW